MNKKSITIGFLSIISIFIVVFIISDLLVSAGGYKERYEEKKIQSKIQVAVSFYPLYYFSQKIGGDKANVFNITPIDANPYSYQPTNQEIIKIENSNLIILNGLGLETWSDNIQNLAESKNKIFIFASGDLSENQVLENNNDGIDPHIWLSPMMAKQMVTQILNGFLQADSKNSNYYKSNAEKLKLELDKLDSEYRNGLANCQNKNIIVSCSAFNYLVKDYGLSQVLMSGLYVNEKLTEQQLNNIVEFSKEQNIKYVFIESLPNFEWQKNIEEKTGIKFLLLNSIEKLTKEEIGRGENYFTEMRKNLVNLKTALQC